MLSKQPLLNISLSEAITVAVCAIAIMGYTIISFEWVPHLSILLALVALLLYGLLRGAKWGDMIKRMAAAVEQGMGAVYLFFFIGLLVAAMMMSGAIPTLMYYGFGLISPEYFYLSAFLLCGVIGISIGSSLTTCATIGVAFMGMSSAFHAVPAITAGAVVSGAFFGDKMSPLSDTTGIAASTVGVDLFEHIKNMSYTTIPALLLTAAALVWAVPDVVSGSLNSVQKLSGELQASGLVHGYALLPFAVLVVLALFKVDAILTMLATIAVSIAITFTHTPLSAGQLGGWLFAGFKPEHVGEGIAKLVSRGGLESMFFTQTVVMLALSLGGLLFALGIVPALLDAMRRFLTNAGRATFCVAMTSVGVNILIGEQYLSILLAGETFKPVYAKLGLHPRNLSRTLEDAGTVINPLVPWSVCGVFIAKVLGVSVLSYLPYAFFCYLCLILTVLFGFTGFTLSKVETEQKPAQQ